MVSVVFLVLLYIELSCNNGIPNLSPILKKDRREDKRSVSVEGNTVLTLETVNVEQF